MIFVWLETWMWWSVVLGSAHGYVGAGRGGAGGRGAGWGGVASGQAAWMLCVGRVVGD